MLMLRQSFEDCRCILSFPKRWDNFSWGSFWLKSQTTTWDIERNPTTKMGFQLPFPQLVFTPDFGIINSINSFFGNSVALECQPFHWKNVGSVWMMIKPYLHPGRLTWNLHITNLERKMIFQASMIMFHVNLKGCIIDLLKKTHPRWTGGVSGDSGTSRGGQVSEMGWASCVVP